MALDYNKPINDRRQNERKIFFSDAYLILNGRRPIKARTWDISKGGMSLIISENLKPEVTCTLRFTIFIDKNNTQDFEVKVKIIHCYFRSNSGFVVGLQFIKPTDRLKDTITDFLNH